jgi:hypothetical protein
MFRRLTATTIAAAALLAFSAVPASAAETAPAPAPLSLSGYSVTISAPPATAATVASAPNCDTRQRLFCGYVVVDASFSGLGDDVRPVSQAPAGWLAGTISVTRGYGCQNPGGRIVHRFDRTVTETVPLAPRAFGGFPLPATGDVLNTAVYAFLPDSQPGNCPASFTSVNTSITAKGAKLTLTSYSESFVGGTYTAPRRATWRGVAPTPIAGYATL